MANKAVSFGALGGKAPDYGLKGDHSGEWFFDFDPKLAKGHDKAYVSYERSDDKKLSAVRETKTKDLDVYVLDAEFEDIKTGVRVRETDEVYIYDVKFDGIYSNDKYGSAFAIGETGDPTRGTTYIKNVEADGGKKPLNSYSQSNTDFLKTGRQNGDTYVKYATASNFSDAMVDGKSTVYLMNVTFDSAFRALRVWDGEEIIIVNSEINVPKDETLIWLGGKGSKVKYYNTTWNGKSDPDPDMVDLDGGSSMKQIQKLSSNPLPKKSSFFDDEISTVSFDVSKDGGKTWEKLKGGTFGEEGEALRGDVHFDLNIPKGSNVDIRANVLLTDGRYSTTGAMDMKKSGKQTVDLADFKPGDGSVTPTKPEGTKSSSSSKDTVEKDADTNDSGQEYEATVYLVDAKTDKVITKLNDGTTIDIDDIEGKSLNIEVRYLDKGADADSVVMDLNNGEARIVENYEPFALFGDKNGNFNGGLDLNVGSHKLTVSGYTDQRAKGDKLGETDVFFSVVDSDAKPSGGSGGSSSQNSSSSKTGVYLIDAKTDKIILELKDGIEIDAADIKGKSLNIEVRSLDSKRDVDSVVFDLNDGEKRAVESYEPFALFGDRNGNFNGGLDLDVGSHELSIDQYSGKRGTGKKVEELDISFSVVDGDVKANTGGSSATTIDVDAPDAGSAIDGMELFLVDAKTDRIVAEVRDGAEVNIDGLGDDLNMVVRFTDGDNPGSVTLDLDDVREWTENLEPYALFGDKDGDFNGGLDLDTGSHEVTITEHSRSRGEGRVEEETEVSFSVVSRADAPMATGEVTVETGGRMIGSDGADVIDGGSAAEEIFGNDGNDILTGGAGNDVINGGEGDDRILGGAGDDTFLFSADMGSDTVLDFDPTRDVLNFSEHSGVSSRRDLNISQDGDSVVIRDGEGGQVELLFVNASELSDDALVF